MKQIASKFSIGAITCAITLNVISGCAEEPPPANAQPSETKPSAWKSVNGSTIVSADRSDEALAAAIEQARKSVESARVRWTLVDDDDRQNWAVKWAAPTIDQGVEHVWVYPINWSPFRIEGILMSQPVSELECGKREGDLVGFAIEELTDWIHYLDSSNETRGDEFEGGFTVKVLEEQFGKPPVGD